MSLVFLRNRVKWKKGFGEGQGGEMEHSFREQYKNQVKILADQMRDEPLPALTEDLFALFETTGNRLQYENVYFRRRKFLAVYGIAVCMFQRQEDVKKLAKVMEDICAEECWALPAHVNRKTDAAWRVTVDLFASETAQALAELVSFVNVLLPKEHRLPKELCIRVRDEIERRVFAPFFSSSPNYGCWECSDHNWNAVCVGSIGSACIYLMEGKEEERLSGCLRRLCHSLAFYLDGFKDDGACMEGIGYFTYGMTYFVGFAEQLLHYSKGAINLFDNEKMRRIACFQQKMYFQSGKTVSFSDGEQAAKFRMGLTSFLARQYPEVRLPSASSVDMGDSFVSELPVQGCLLAADFESDSCYRFMGLLRDYIWTEELPTSGSPQNISGTAGTALPDDGSLMKRTSDARHDILPDAQWSICESAVGTAMAVKGGTNGEPHNHNDVGSFFYLAGDEFLLTDLGAGEYTKDYFGEGRYHILCNSSLGHSVPIIGGSGQKAGAEYKASEFRADGNGTTLVEFAGAYERGAVNRLVRETHFDLDTGVLTVLDAYDIPEETDSFTEQLVTQGEVSIAEHKVRIVGERHECVVQLPEEVQRIWCQEEEHRNHAGILEPVRLIRWEVPLRCGKENKGTTWFTVTSYKR